ncbi:MAG: hypothetical protein AAF825_05820, partial [Pseudomonadota bacterium]
VIFAEGAATESFHPGHQGLASLSPASREALFTRCPGLRADPESLAYALSARASWARATGRAVGP